MKGNIQAKAGDIAPASTRISSADGLLEAGLIPAEAYEDVQKLSGALAIGLSPHITALLRDNPDNKALHRQYVPDAKELILSPLESGDPIGDKAHTPVKGIVHRYPDRVLLKVASACAVYCRYCFRREMIGPKAAAEAMSAGEREAALDYIRSTPDIWEVILTGGDPFILNERHMRSWLEDISAIPHVQIIRIHTRIPVADPARITREYVQALKESCSKPLYIVLHANHADEITPEVAAALSLLREEGGCTLLSQSVLLRGVNDSAAELENLFRTLICHHVKPYYLHHPDMARGTAHFRLPLREGLALYRGLLGRISGICQPHYVLDIPGGFGKTPINASMVTEIDKHHYRVEDYQGQIHSYFDDPAKQDGL